MNKKGKVDWIKFKNTSEKIFKTIEIEECWGFQIQPNTRWNKGLTEEEIAQLQNLFGVKFPLDYIEMLKVCNGFETLHISIDPETSGEYTFNRECYKYPDDINKVSYLIDDANKYLETIKKILENDGFQSVQIEGFIPLYSHRVLVILQDKTLSPVLSIHGSDIIIYGKSLLTYWRNEFHIKV